MPESQKKPTSQMSRAETYLRAICKEKGVPFSQAMEQVVATMRTPRDDDEIPSLDQQFAQFGGLDKFLSTHCKNTPKASMSISNVKKPVAAVKPASTLREAELTQQLNTAKMELSRAQGEATAAKAEAADAKAKLEATERPRRAISRIAK